MTTTLNTLPSTIFGLILDGSDRSCLILDLWKCGNRLLNGKISQGVTEVHLSHPSFRMFRVQEAPRSLYPRILSNLHNLRSLTIETRANLTRFPAEGQLELCKLPLSLERLVIRSPDAEYGLLNFAPESAESHSPYIVTDYPRGPSRYWKIASYWPRLHTLEIAGGNPSPELSDLAGLPDSLTSLTSSARTHRTPFMHLLPRHLVRLEMDADASVLDFSQAPPSLEYISAVSATSMQKDNSIVSFIASLPASLHLGTLRLSTWSSHYAQALSQVNLDILYLQGKMGSPIADTEHWIAELPRSLKQLHLPVMGVSLSPLFAHVPELPPGLTKLDINANNTDWDGLEGFIERSGGVEKYWPKSLRFFTYCPSTAPTVAHFDLLPASLTSLRINYPSSEQEFQDGKTVIDVSELPKSLTACALQYRSSAASTQIFFKGTMPTSLKVFDFTPPSVFDGASLVSTFSSESSPLVQFALTSMLPINEPLALPSQIESLILQRWQFSWFGAIPKNVTRLSISSLADCSSFSEAQGTDLFAALPSSLTKLELVTSAGVTEPQNNILFASSSLSTLTNLKHLEISSKIGRFPSSVFRSMSPNLLMLELAIDSFDLSDAPFVPTSILQGTLSGESVDWAPLKPLLPSTVRLPFAGFGGGFAKKGLGFSAGATKGGPVKVGFGAGAAKGGPVKQAPSASPAERPSKKRARN